MAWTSQHTELAKNIAKSAAFSAVAVVPALWLWGGVRGARLVGTSMAAGLAVTTAHMAASRIEIRRSPVLPASGPVTSPALAPPNTTYIDVMGSPIEGASGD